MFTTTSGIKRSFYNQTGEFQFNTNLVINSLFGGLNVGISGFGSGNTPNKINYYCNSGKIWDNSGRFVGAYKPNEQFSISGNVNSGSYDYFINGRPTAYGNTKNTGTYNYFYLNPSNISCDYNFFINGERPRLALSGIKSFTGDSAGTGYIFNLNPRLPVTIFSGNFTNFNNMPFTVSSIFTGILNPLSSGAIYITPTPGQESGLYTGNLQLITNGGVFNLSNQISISGSTELFPFTFDLNGSSLINNGETNLYTSDITCFSGSGIPIVVSLEHVSGSGNYYTNIDVFSGYSGIISGYIVNTGILSQFFSGIGTGAGGQFANTGSGLVSGRISGDFQYATGNFIWYYGDILSTGWGSGTSYTGYGTGLLSTNITGIIGIGSGTYLYNSGITGNLNTIKSTGPTGFLHGTGGIFFNTPSNFDKLYVSDQSFAIVYNFHYNSLSSLTSYFNSNTGTHKVTAINDGINTVILSGIRGIETNVGLTLDDTNLGNMALSTPVLLGGQDIGIGSNIISIGPVTGFLVNTFEGSGTYVSTGQGILAGSGNVIDFTKFFTGIWGLTSGNLDYWAAGFYNAGQNKYLNNYPVNYVNSTLMAQVSYVNNFGDSYVDVAKITVSGLGFNSGLQLLISGST